MRLACKLMWACLIHVCFELLELYSYSCLIILFSLASGSCCHGHLDDKIATLLRAQEREGVSIDLLL